MSKMNFPITVNIVYFGKLKFGMFGRKRLNTDATSFAILSLNKIQDCFEFNIYQEEKDIFLNAKKNFAILFDDYLRSKGLLKKNRTYIAITGSHIMNNWFHTTMSPLSVISIRDWLKRYSPPNYIEYIINSIIDTLIHSIAGLGPHDETRGCCLDYTKYKNQLRWGIPIGYICNECKEKIINKTNQKFYNYILSILSFDWVGSISDKNSIANRLKRYYNFDIRKDTGLQKKWWEKIIGSFYLFPKEFLIALLIAIISFLLGKVS